jgi:hypothetical protein
MRVALGCLLAAVALATVACGGGHKSNGVASQSPSQIVASVKKAVAASTSAHVIGAGSTGGTKLAIDMTYDNKDNSATGHLSVNGLAFELTYVGGKTYVKANAGFYSHFTGAAAAALLAGKWILVPANDPRFAAVSSLASLTALTNAIFQTTGPFTVGDETTINGEKAIPVFDKGQGGTLYVATSGPAYPLRISPGKKTGSGKIDFTDWDKHVSITAPSDAVDLTKLLGGGSK